VVTVCVQLLNIITLHCNDRYCIPTIALSLSIVYVPACTNCSRAKATLRRFHRKSQMFQQLPELMPSCSSNDIGKRVSQFGPSPPTNSGYVLASLRAKCIVKLLSQSVYLWSTSKTPFSEAPVTSRHVWDAYLFDSRHCQTIGKTQKNVWDFKMQDILGRSRFVRRCKIGFN